MLGMAHELLLFAIYLVYNLLYNGADPKKLYLPFLWRLTAIQKMAVKK